MQNPNNNIVFSRWFIILYFSIHNKPKRSRNKKLKQQKTLFHLSSENLHKAKLS